METGDGGPGERRADGGALPPEGGTGDPHSPPSGTTPSGAGPAPAVDAAPGAWGPTAGPAVADATPPPPGAAGPTGSAPPRRGPHGPADGVAGPAGRPTGSRTDGLAIAALVTGIVGACAPLGLVLGLVSLRRIRRSGGRRTGRGLAIAGVLLSLVWMAAGAVVVVGLSQGWFQHRNVEDWPDGEEHEIAEVIDSLEQAYRDGDADAMCDHFIPESRAIIESEPEGCDGLVEGRTWYYVPDSVIQDITIDGASAQATVEEADDTYTAHLVQVDGEWRLLDLVF